MRFLLDTNIVSALMRRPADGPVVDRIRRAGEKNVCTSVIVAAELRYGAAKNPARWAVAVHRVLGALDVLPLETPADVIYGQLRTDLEARGELIGPNDLLIAAQALALDCVLVTGNEREFGRVRNLAVQNWLAAA